MSESESGSTYHHDIVVSAIVFALTGFLHKACHVSFERKVPRWGEISYGLRNRICVEMAILPSRMALGYAALPICLSAFSPQESWHAEDTERALLAW